MSIPTIGAEEGSATLNGPLRGTGFQVKTNENWYYDGFLQVNGSGSLSSRTEAHAGVILSVGGTINSYVVVWPGGQLSG